MPVPTGIVLHGLGPLMHSVKLHPALGSGGNEFRGSRNRGENLQKNVSSKCWFKSKICMRCSTHMQTKSVYTCLY